MPELPPNAGPVLCGIAREAIAARLGVSDPRSRTADAPQPPVPQENGQLGSGNVDSWLHHPGAAFVTLTIKGKLRGCIGSLSAYQPLRGDVAANAVNAAFRDPRFSPLTADELPETRIEVSVLSEAEPYPFTDRADALARLRPGVDGLTLEYGARRGTFLPQVWESLPEPDAFLTHLVRKAGLPDGWWSDDARLSRYTVTAFEEP